VINTKGPDSSYMTRVGTWTMGDAGGMGDSWAMGSWGMVGAWGMATRKRGTKWVWENLVSREFF
jgi:hypothetical protein